MSAPRWDPALTQAQREAIRYALDYVPSEVAGRLRAAFAAKPRELLGWASAAAMDDTGDGDGYRAVASKRHGAYTIRVRVTEIGEGEK